MSVEPRTASVVIPASQDTAFAFLSKIENHPRWATEFIQELRATDGGYKVVTPMGEMFYRVEADADTGVIDIYTGPSAGEMALFPTRVTPLPDGSSVYIFSMLPAPGTPPEVIEDQYTSLQRELANLPGLIK